MLLPSYDAFGLVWLHNGAVRAVPLLHVHVTADIVDFCAKTTIKQRFINVQTQPLEAIYVFPVDERAAVCGFEAEIDGVVTKGIVKEKSEARKTYNDAIARGDGAQLLEQKRTDIFELSVGNLQPGQTAVISITYVADLKIDGSDVSYFLPTFVAPRYSPATETDPIPTGNVHDSVLGLQLAVNCSMSQPITNVHSPSHQIIVQHETQAKTAVVTLAGGVMHLDSDFVLLVGTVNPHQPRVCVEVASDGSVATLITIAPAIDIGEQKCEFIFLIDESGSMSGAKSKQARSAMNFFLRSLPEDCYFNIVGFGDSYRKLWRQSVRYTADTLNQATAHLETINGNLGGTEILQPLEDILSAKLLPGYARQVFVLTDGEVSNTHEVIDCVLRHAHQSRVFSLGLGAGASHELVEGIARAGKGTAEFVVNERLESKVIQQLKTALHVALSDVTVDWEIPTHMTLSTTAPTNDAVVDSSVNSSPTTTSTVVTNVEGATGSLLHFQLAPSPERVFSQAPFNVPPILSGSRFLIFCLSRPGTPTPTSATIKANTPVGPLAVRLSACAADYIHGDLVHKMAARYMIKDLQEGTSYQHSLKGAATWTSTQIREEIIRLGLAYQLASQHTSFVAVQDRDPSFQQDVHLGSLSSPEPEPQVQRDAVNYYGPRRSYTYSSSSTSDEIQDMMAYNIDAVLARGEMLDSIECKSASLDASSRQFVRSSAPRKSKKGGGVHPCVIIPIVVVAAPFVLAGYPFYKLYTWTHDRIVQSRTRRVREAQARSMEQESKQEQQQPASTSSATPLPSQSSAGETTPSRVANSTADIVASSSKQASHTPPKKSTLSIEQTVGAVISLQQFDGSFVQSSKLLDLLDVTRSNVDELTTHFGASSDDLAFTALVVTFLEFKAAHLADEWQLIADKARRWLGKNSTSTSVADVISAAKVLLQGGSLKTDHDASDA